jgi:hypothetical protein
VAADRRRERRRILRLGGDHDGAGLPRAHRVATVSLSVFSSAMHLSGEQYACDRDRAKQCSQNTRPSAVDIWFRPGCVGDVCAEDKTQSTAMGYPSLPCISSLSTLTTASIHAHHVRVTSPQGRSPVPSSHADAHLQVVGRSASGARDDRTAAISRPKGGLAAGHVPQHRCQRDRDRAGVMWRVPGQSDRAVAGDDRPQLQAGRAALGEAGGGGEWGCCGASSPPLATASSRHCIADVLQSQLDLDAQFARSLQMQDEEDMRQRQQSGGPPGALPYQPRVRRNRPQGQQTQGQDQSYQPQYEHEQQRDGQNPAGMLMMEEKLGQFAEGGSGLLQSQLWWMFG